MNDPDRYGASFADVYDRWYPGDDQLDVVAHLQQRLPAGAKLLELGVGTGRLALPLAGVGFSVTGLDPSSEMLAQLAAKDPHGTVAAVRGDAADPASWPPGRFDCVLAACNLLLNLADPAAQRRALATAADRLSPAGLLVVELSAVDLHEDQGARGLEVRSVSEDAVVLIATEADPSTGVVNGAHVELRHGEPVCLRPWRIRALPLPQLDTWADESGLELTERHADWTGTPAHEGAAGTVSVFRRR